MSTLSDIWTDVKNFFVPVAEKVPAAKQALADLQAAETSALAAIDPIADAVVNAGLAELPIVGPLSEPIADALLNSLIDKFTTKLKPVS